MAKRDFITCDMLASVLRYHDGALYWAVNIGSKIKAGSRASTPHNGYRRIGVFGIYIREHHIVWMLAYEEWPNPELEIDHINGIKNDNRRENLRLVTHTENQQNHKLARSNSKSGILGVYWHKSQKKWSAQIVVSGRQIHLGNFSLRANALAARLIAELIYFKIKQQ